MLGLLLKDMEQKEIEYLLKREMDELLMDLEDHRIDHVVKRAMEERYKILYQLFKRLASKHDCIRYVLPKRKHQ
ncbi:hypothetical protein N780_08995 [Pontibacillus chungwhensis BH030062]|uniref:Uncharacterized protein n=2 Tax=Pontibacillus TaxID=289201 RepID=A0A0A2UT65_9BACI|nr:MULTISPECIES: hypothetical protein [Pontibacillus]KGP89691.1 hypothetical protein N780_08995 [Pontibacillus chungwhensis BH030062]QST00230.1 hypothetical protein IMZ31_00940 [Pontibacillus sp. ALD_SL1]GGD26561.1 hypothetical protein GCM10011389_37550 [Pontibacillus salipaludis]